MIDPLPQQATRSLSSLHKSCRISDGKPLPRHQVCGCHIRLMAERRTEIRAISTAESVRATWCGPVANIAEPVLLHEHLARAGKSGFCALLLHWLDVRSRRTQPCGIFLRLPGAHLRVERQRSRVQGTVLGSRERGLDCQVVESGRRPWLEGGCFVL